jgi:competence protein ComEC
MELFCFFLGVVYTYTLNSYSLFLLLCIFFLTPCPRVILFFLLGGLVAWGHLWWVQPTGMPNEAVIPNAVLQGKIASIPVSTKNKTQFIFLITLINGQKAHALVNLSWYNTSAAIHVDEQWKLITKMKQPRNFLNPGSYDFVQAMKTRHIYWVGYIRSGVIIQPAQTYNFLSFREQLNNKLIQLAPNKRVAGVVQSLTLNTTTHISQEDWELFRRTGTTHLFGISGEHIALISGLSFFIFRYLWSRCAACCLKVPAHSMASAGGLIVALIYALLAGFAPPVQRALIGYLFYALSYLGIRRFTPWQVWRYALVGILCIEPHAVFMQGFYFSFLAVACLLLTHQRWRMAGYKNKIALQVSCLVGLMPLSLYWFSYGSVNGFIANLFAIPLVGFFIIPLSLITLCISSFNWAWMIMLPLSWLINLLFTSLAWIERIAVININWPLNSIELALPLLGALLLWVLLPIKPFKYIALLWLILPFFPPKNIIPSGEALIQVLDVGQGLAVHVQTKNHVLLYDTGDQFFQGSDLGQMVILPFYKTVGVKKIDAIVISHPDRDHLGGLKSIENALPVQRLIVNDPKFYHRGLNCHHYSEWVWDEVYFRFLPINMAFKNKNNNSCILQISTSENQILLTGDIEKEAEDYLIRTYPAQLKSEVLIMPHHGSKTSSSYRFLLEVAPQYAIASLGFDNRFRFPHEKTLTTLKALKIPFYRTDHCGLIKLRLTKAKELSPPSCYTRSSND